MAHKKQNYYERVVKRFRQIRRDPIFVSWARKKKLTGPQITRAIHALIQGKGSFEL